MSIVFLNVSYEYSKIRCYWISNFLNGTEQGRPQTFFMGGEVKKLQKNCRCAICVPTIK